MKTGPLSFGQQRLWFLHQFDPKDPSHNTGYAYRLRGALDVAKLEAAFTAVVARHGALRTRFTGEGGEPRAVVEDPRPVRIEVTAAESAEHAERIVSARAHTPFDLTAGPPLRVTLVRLGPGDHVLCAVTHHINSDGWSFNVLRDEVAAHYSGQPLPAAPLQYADVVAAAGAPADPAWWVERLAGAPDLELPTDRPRPAERSADGAEVRFTVEKEQADAVRSLARKLRCTPYMVLLAAYQVLLARHSGQSDFCVGTPAAGRGRPELEGVVGYLSTTMVLRCDLGGDPAFADVVRATRRSVLSGLAHPEVPFEQLVGALGVARDLSRTPVYQALFALHTHGTVAEPLPGLDAEPFPFGWHAARTDLTLDLYEQPDGSIAGILIHSTDLFDGSTAERMAARFLRLLDSATSAPDLPVSGLELLPVAERELLASWDGPVVELPPVTLVDLVLAQAQASPDAVAVVAGTTVLTYRQLVAAASRLGADLRERGAGRGARVAVVSSRRAQMLVALLGVAMSGAGYVPVDPEYPRARIDYVVGDCGAALVLTDADLDTVLDNPDNPDGVVVGLPRPEPCDTAYVLYTSGSTGRPKGVVVPHRALVNFLLAMRSLVASTAGDRWLALTSLSFDISALELYLPLVTGGRVVVADAATARDTAALCALVREEGVTHVQATPSGWRLLLAGDLPAVTALCGGEPLPPALAAGLRARVARLLNMYGPTETTIWSTAWEVPEQPGRVTIGTPIANTTVRVLTADGAPAPVGVPGELLIGGAGLADGYHGRPALTAERFTTVHGQRLYRTGDIVRRLPDGTLEYHGRTDDQLKLRGHRIEPGEIAAALETHPGIRQAVVTVHDENLTAHYVPHPAPPAPEPGELRTHLAALLPGYMIPTHYLPLTTLPLTPNGKIDRKALPHPGAGQRPAGKGRAPRTAAEELVAAIYAEVLDLAEEVCADDDFFALGGHSLRAAMLTSRLNARSGAAIPVGDVFRHPVVADLARLVEAASPGTVSGPVPRPVGVQPPLSPAQERLWFMHRLDPH
ncbi:amino acid adenylation domain-containing protein, partial [Streptomyces sp. NPDC020983]|uniref:amino acid adenylation domain-containing protein n=1 Tax=Streptomyces sp. NPDC020983 TaxID=3365106 RepID=UPI0037A04B01